MVTCCVVWYWREYVYMYSGSSDGLVRDNEGFSYFSVSEAKFLHLFMFLYIQIIIILQNFLKNNKKYGTILIFTL